jgi:CheY-like chemotaxis protein
LFSAEVGIKIKGIYERQNMYMSSIYHEIKTPMNGIVCATELITDGVEKLIRKIGINEEITYIEEWLDITRTSCLSLTEMIENMLTYSRLQSNLKLEVKPIQVKAILSPLKKLISTYPKSAEVTVVIENPHDNEWVLASQIALHQSLLNVMTNAIKFTMIGEVRLTSHLDRETKTIVFEVSDTGIGMTKKFLQTGLFEPFEQEDKSLFGQRRGLGLGMVLCKQMVEKMNGRIAVYSERGKGTKVVIIIPSVADVQIQSEFGGTTGQYAVVNALVVDDNATNLRVMAQFLKILGFKCSTASSGEEAIDFVRRSSGDLNVIFMDVFMPGMGGIEASKRIQVLTAGWRKPPLIVGCTADTNEDTINECIKCGITTFANKPVNRKQLSAIFRQLTSEK